MIAKWPLQQLLLFCFTLILLATGTGQSALWDIDEPNNAQALKEMTARGDYILPTFNGELRPDKPILNYWLMAGMTRIIGFNEWGLRAGAVLMGALLVLLIAAYGRRLFNAPTGLIAGLLCATTLHSQVIFRAAVPDALLIFFSALALLSWINGYTHPAQRRRDYLLSYAALACAVLAKGPIGVLLPGLIILLFLLWRRDLPHLWRQGHLLLGIPLFLAIALPWYVAVWVVSDGEWLRLFLEEHNVGRFQSSLEGHQGPFWFYLAASMPALLPWSVFLPQALARPWRQHGGRLAEKAPIEAFLMLWAAVWILFFSLAATKLPNYAWPAYPPLFMLIGLRLQQALSGTAPLHRAGGLASALLLLALGAALSVAGYLLPQQVPGLPDVGILGWPYLLAGVIVAVLLWRQRLQASLSTMAAAALVFTFTLVLVALPPLEAFKPARDFGRLIHTLEGERPYTLATWGWFQPSFLFYAGEGEARVTQVQSTAALMAMASTQKTLYLAIPKENLKALPAMLKARVIAETWDMYAAKMVVLVSIQRPLSE